MVIVKKKEKEKPRKKLDKTKTRFITSCMFLNIRFRRHFWLVGTEVYTCGSIADIIAVDNNMVHEFEVKISCADINKERKKKKHQDKNRMPNYFTLVIPHEKRIYKCAKKFVDEVNPKYGITTIGKDYIIRVKKGSQMLHRSHNDHLESLKKRIFQRATSELANLRKKVYGIKGFDR